MYTITARSFICSLLFVLFVVALSLTNQPVFANTTQLDASSDISFSSEELAYLQAKKKITMCIDPDWLPLEKIEGGKHIGMTADYFALFQQKIPVPITLVNTANWPESIEFAKARKCDIFSLAMPTPERDTYMDFTEPYLSIPLVMAAKVNKPFIDDITTLRNATLGVVSGYAFGELLRTRYPKMDIVDVDSVTQGLQKVSQGELDGFIGTLATVGYTIQKSFPSELKVAGKFDQRWELGVATRNDEPLLLSVFEKAIASIDQAEKQQILNRWIAVKFEQGVDYTLIWRVLFFAGIGIIFLLYRNRTLSQYSKTLKDQNEQISKQTNQLQEAEKQLLITQHAIDLCAFPVLWVVKGKTLQETQVIYANLSASELLDYTPEETRKLSLADLDAEQTDATWQLALRKMYNNSSLPIKTKYRKRNGSEFPVDLFASDFEYDYQQYLFLFFVDITRQNELEEKLNRSMKMESIGLMAGGVAHDLNNILSSIIGYPELIMLSLPEDSNIREHLEKIKDSGKRASEVVADLLTVARGIAAEKVIANPNLLILEYLQSPEHARSSRITQDVECITDLDDDLLNITCSPVHVKKCLMNLITNALEAIENSGTITISTTNYYSDLPSGQIKHLEEGEYVRLTVSDSGSGVDPKDLEHIFEPFYTRKTMGRSGTGLGLAIVWNTMEDHGGTVTVESDNKGTIFELYFPATRKPLAIASGDLPADEIKGNGEKILIVDDESQQLDIATKMLTSLGYKVSSVRSGEEAISYLQTKQVDLIVLDMIMSPGINGRQTYEEIIKIHPAQKAIIASGYTKTDEVKKAQQLGAGQFIKKPYLRHQIGLAVKEALKERAA